MALMALIKHNVLLKINFGSFLDPENSKRLFFDITVKSVELRKTQDQKTHGLEK